MVAGLLEAVERGERYCDSLLQWSIEELERVVVREAVGSRAGSIVAALI